MAEALPAVNGVSTSHLGGIIDILKEYKYILFQFNHF